jgi:hypothetical protein
MALYLTHNSHPAHSLFYTWSGWPSEAGPGPFPPEPDAAFFTALADLWKTDGLTLISRTWTPNVIQLTFSVTPDITPMFFTQRVKGRLQHALRAAGQPTVFSRKVGMRAIGENITPVVENYLARQTHRSAFADERYRSTLAAESFEDTTLDLAEPTEVKRGRYWYNLHLVMVTAGRFRMGKEDFALKLRTSAQSAAVEHGCALKAFAPMPDHIHLALRGKVERAPVDIGVAFQNSLGRAAGCRLWDDRFYVP